MSQIWPPKSRHCQKNFYSPSKYVFAHLTVSSVFGWSHLAGATASKNIALFQIFIPINTHHTHIYRHVCTLKHTQPPINTHAFNCTHRNPLRAIPSWTTQYRNYSTTVLNSVSFDSLSLPTYIQFLLFLLFPVSPVSVLFLTSFFLHAGGNGLMVENIPPLFWCVFFLKSIFII